MTRGQCDGPREYFCFRKVTPANHSPWSRPAGKWPGILRVFQLVTSLSLAGHHRARYQPSQPVGNILYIIIYHTNKNMFNITKYIYV